MQEDEAVRGEDVHREHKNASSAASSADAAPAVRYEPPKLVRVGSLRNLLGKSGAVPDKGPPFELHQ
jgi:hypothetical protein